MFQGAQGTFDVARVYEFLNALTQDQSGQLSAYWKFLETEIYRDQLFTKYASLLEKSTFMTPLDKVAEIDNNNIASNVQFVMKPVGIGVDSTIVVSNKEIQDYYNSHKRSYKREASRDIEYVVFEVEPSAEDLKMAKEDIEKVYGDFQTSENLKAFLTRNSDKPLDTYYYTEDEYGSLNSKVGEFIKSADAQQTSPVFQEGNVYMAARIADVKKMPDSIFVKHILLQGVDMTAMKAQADSLVNVLKGGADFAQLAAQYSADKNPNVESAGDLGWLTQRYMLPGFESLMTAPVNKYQVMETRYGVHIAVVTDVKNVKERKQIAVLTKEAVASDRTYQSYYAKANELATKSNSSKADFEAAAKELGYRMYTANNIAQGAKKVSRFDNARELSRWAFEAKVGDVSPVISIDNQYFFIATLNTVKERGYAPMSEVSATIKNVLVGEKRAQKLAEEVSKQIAGLTTMEEIAEKLGLTISTEDALTFGAQGKYSLDPAFIGAATSAQVGVISAPVAGKLGVYVFKVLDRQTGAYFTEDDAMARSKQKVSFQTRMLPMIMADNADIEDNRGKFF